MAKKKVAKYNRITAFDIALYVIMILFMACIVVPFLHVIAVSFSQRGPVMRGEVSLWPIGFNIDTYKQMLSDGKFGMAYVNTIFYTVVGTALSLITTAMAAYALSRQKIVGHKLFTVMITITMFFGGGLIPTFLTVSNYGLTDTRWSMILPYLINTWNLIVMRSFFIAYPNEIIESGEIDGLRDPGVFLKLVLPTSKAALATIGLYYAVAYWNAYMPARIYIRNQELYPVQHLLQQMIASVTGEDAGQGEGQLVAATVRYCSIMIVITPIMCVYPFIQKYFVKGVMVGSIKG
jgi:putative aldouronate transport system permease protein